ncbi:WD40 repeat-like protein [Aspergillus ellipticus CBS 707.79]|uniref:WD40 repeat-like protein n=1 Tax=Aspergillus ellipticus CBS 707.79 TaxID=1448320 RepID=A0A319DMC5_9EURO|nr:WD40 repeat-like protein [Aspergillus ellipticus CBS 707.79]
MLISGFESNLVQAWNTGTWQKIQTFHSDVTDSENSVLGMVFFPDSQLVASCSSNGKVKVWKRDTTTWDLKWTFHPASRHTSLALSSDSLLLASASDEPIIQIWDMRSGKLHHEIRDSDDVLVVSFSQDNLFLVSGSTSAIRLWHTATWELAKTVHTDSPFLHVRRIIDCSLVVTWSRGGTIKIWHGRTAEIHKIFKAGMSPRAVAISLNNELVAGASCDGELAVWKTETCEMIMETQAVDLMYQGAGPRNIQFSSNNQLLGAISGHKIVKVRDTKTRNLLKTASGQTLESVLNSAQKLPYPNKMKERPESRISLE